MHKLQKILDEIDETIKRYGKNPYIDEKVTDICYGLNIAKNIINKHMNDGWVPVEERLPEKERKSYLVTYRSKNGRRYVKEAYLEYVGKSPKVAYWTKRNKGRVIAWCPLPDPYSPERRN